MPIKLGRFAAPRKGSPIGLFALSDIYERLAAIGFDRSFVQSFFLPDWWDDGFASNPTERAIAEATIAKMLGFPIADLRDPRAPLRVSVVSDVRLKSKKNTRPDDYAPAILLAQQTANAIAAALADSIPVFNHNHSATRIREHILQSRDCVDLDAIVDFCWKSGVPVIHLSNLPECKKFTAMAMFCGSIPAIVITSGRDSPPWLAFYVAHELGHICKGHVKPGTPPIADDNFESIADNDQEEEADDFACKILAGRNRIPSSWRNFTAVHLRHDAIRYGKARQIDPGYVALMYGRARNRWGVANGAINYMGQESGGRALILRELKKRLPTDADETTSRFIELILTP